MATMIPRLDTREEIEETIKEKGCKAERVIYELMQNNDYLPKDWYVIWNKRVSNQTTNHQYDFVVLVPDHGVMIVDAKGSGYGYNEKGVFGCSYTNEKTGSKEFNEMPDMFNKIQNAKDALRKDLEDQFGRFGACNCLVVFIDKWEFERSPSQYDWVDDIENQLKKDKDFLKETIISHLQQNVNGKDLKKENPFFNKRKMIEIKEYFAKVNEWPLPFQSDFYDWDIKGDGYFSLQQQAIFELAMDYEAMHIEGAAGTGKTIIAMGLAREYAKQGKEVLYVCYNRNLADDLNDKKKSNHWQYVQITTFDALGSVVIPDINNTIRDFLVWPKPDNKEREGWNDLDWGKERKRIVDSIFDCNVSRLRAFDVIIVDEAQDFDEDPITALFCLMKETGKIFIFSDPNQNIFNRNSQGEKKGWDTKKLFVGMKQPPPEQQQLCKLNQNWRNTKQIHSHYNGILKVNSISTFSGKVEVINVQQDQVSNLLEDLLTKKKRRPANIVLLSIGGAAISIESVNYKGKMSIPVTRDIRRWRNGDVILKTTVESFKGLDSDIVILFGDVPLDEKCREDRKEQRKRDRYVGESRAKYELYIVS